mmetsp:Transcript_32001/g.61859  ORF Transcript_32001/g.61859 Transcript_32001/m.61859 type:complete len:151 (-) Transcript_32001:85-537(-)
MPRRSSSRYNDRRGRDEQDDRGYRREAPREYRDHRSRSRGSDRDRYSGHDDRRESRRRSNSRGRVVGGIINFKGKDVTSKVEGPNDKHCYRAFCEVTKNNGVKVTAAGPWEGDKRSADRDEAALLRAFSEGGAEALFKKKSELFRKRHGR